MTKNTPEYTNYQRYLETYSGRTLLQQHSLEQEGVWRIKGEDPNCDLGGYHHEPELAVVTGRLKDVIMYGVNLSGFWNWGSGGSFEYIGKSIPQIDQNTLEKKKQLASELALYEAKVQDIKKQLDKLL